MPLYEYKCRACGETFEVLQKFSDAPLKKHAKCGGAVERLISPPAFQFKGTGWYVTDYAKGHDRKGSNGGEKKTESKPKSSETAASKPPETKPAANEKSPSKA